MIWAWWLLLLCDAWSSWCDDATFFCWLAALLNDNKEAQQSTLPQTERAQPATDRQQQQRTTTNTSEPHDISSSRSSSSRALSHSSSSSVLSRGRTVLFLACQNVNLSISGMLKSALFGMSYFGHAEKCTVPFLAGWKVHCSISGRLKSALSISGYNS